MQFIPAGWLELAMVNRTMVVYSYEVKSLGFERHQKIEDGIKAMPRGRTQGQPVCSPTTDRRPNSGNACDGFQRSSPLIRVDLFTRTSVSTAWPPGDRK